MGGARKRTRRYVLLPRMTTMNRSFLLARLVLRTGIATKQDDDESTGKVDGSVCSHM